MVSIDEGRQIDGSREQLSNADSPRFDSLEPHSNAKYRRPKQVAKQELAIVSIEEGIQRYSREKRPVEK
jgi:hypothetical protein